MSTFQLELMWTDIKLTSNLPNFSIPKLSQFIHSLLNVSSTKTISNLIFQTLQSSSGIPRKAVRPLTFNRIHWSVICKLSYKPNWKTFLLAFLALIPFFSQGATTETRPCSGSISNIWEYFFGRKTFGTINSTEIMDEVGPNCQCGCIIHLLKSKPRRMLASSSQACIGHENAVWTVQVREKIVLWWRKQTDINSNDFTLLFRLRKVIKYNSIWITSCFRVPLKAFEFVTERMLGCRNWLANTREEAYSTADL